MASFRRCYGYNYYFFIAVLNKWFYSIYIYTHTNLEPQWPLFLQVNPPKQGQPSNQNKGPPFREPRNIPYGEIFTPWKINGWNIQPSPMKRKENDLNHPPPWGIMFQPFIFQGVCKYQWFPSSKGPNVPEGPNLRGSRLKTGDGSRIRSWRSFRRCWGETGRLGGPWASWALKEKHGSTKIYTKIPQQKKCWAYHIVIFFWVGLILNHFLWFNIQTIHMLGCSLPPPRMASGNSHPEQTYLWQTLENSTIEINTVDGNLKSGGCTSWVGSLPHYLQGFSTIPGGAVFCFPSTVWKLHCLFYWSALSISEWLQFWEGLFSRAMLVWERVEAVSPFFRYSKLGGLNAVSIFRKIWDQLRQLGFTPFLYDSHKKPLAVWAWYGSRLWTGVPTLRVTGDIPNYLHKLPGSLTASLPLKFMMVFTENGSLACFLGARNFPGTMWIFHVFLNQASEAPVVWIYSVCLGPGGPQSRSRNKWSFKSSRKKCPKVNSFHWGDENTLLIGVISLHQTIYIYILSIYNCII